MFLLVRMRRKRTDANGVGSYNSRWVALKLSLLTHMLLSSKCLVYFRGAVKSDLLKKEGFCP